MIKILEEEVVKDEDTFNMIIDFLYNTPKLRRYDYILDYIMNVTNNKEFTYIKNNYERFFYVSNDIYDEIQVGTDKYSDLINIIEESENLNHNKASMFIMKFIDNLFTRYLNNETLKNDLFYSNSGSEPDIKDNEWKDITELRNKISGYTLDNNQKFSDEDCDIIIRNMKKDNQPLYRIEDNNRFSFLSRFKLDIGSVFSFDNEKHNKIISFTSNLHCNPMKQMMLSRRGCYSDDYIIIYETVGDVYSFNIDNLSSYANNIDHCEYEYFVSGTFEVIDKKRVKRNGINTILIKIKQLSK